jgi:hypothetical protein
MSVLQSERPNSNIARINEQNLQNEVTLRLGNNKLRYCSEQRWILGPHHHHMLAVTKLSPENSDLDIAAQEIVFLTNANERLQEEISLKDQKYLELESRLKASQELEEIALAIVCLPLLSLPPLSVSPSSPPLCLSVSPSPFYLFLLIPLTLLCVGK